MYTFQDFEKAKDKKSFIWTLINAHVTSKVVRTAVSADEYDAHRNEGIRSFYKAYNRANGVAFDNGASAMGNNYFQRLNTQRCTYSLGNGVTFNEEGTKEALGVDFDTKLKTLAYNALKHGLSFGFWNMDRLFVFPVTEFAPLWDEETGALRAGVRFWRVDPEKPMFAVLYEEDGFTKYRTKTDNDDTSFVEVEPKKAYKQKVGFTVADGEYVLGEQNYSSLPIIPLWGNKYKQSTLVGMKAQLDNYDLILSGFADNIQSAAEIYWLVENYGGMEQEDANEFLIKLRENHIANIDTSAGGKLTPYTQSIPTEARETLLTRLHTQIFEDFGGLDVHTVSAGSTNDHLEAAYQPMDENADDFEFQIIDFVQQLLKVAGLPEDTPNFKRNRISNIKEQVEVVMLEAPYLDDATILAKLPNISPDEIDSILSKKNGENPSFDSDEPAEEEEEQEEAEE